MISLLLSLIVETTNVTLHLIKCFLSFQIQFMFRWNDNACGIQVTGTFSDKFLRIFRILSTSTIQFLLKNKSWKPESVLSFNMDWRILVFYPEPETRGIKFTNLRQPMLKLKSTFWLPWFISILICLRVQIRYYSSIGRQ